MKAYADKTVQMVQTVNSARTRDGAKTNNTCTCLPSAKHLGDNALIKRHNTITQSGTDDSLQVNVSCSAGNVAIIDLMT